MGGGEGGGWGLAEPLSSEHFTCIPLAYVRGEFIFGVLQYHANESSKIQNK